jgi:tetratricopeptide (TPR) repeat protein
VLRVPGLQCAIMRGSVKKLWSPFPPALLICASIGFSACAGKWAVERSTPAPAPSAAPSPDQDESKILFDSALKDFRARSYDKAVVGFEEVVRIDSGNYEAFFYLGKSRLELNDTVKAESSLNEAIRLKPDYAEAHFELGKHYFDQSRFEKALPFLKDANKYNNKWPDALVLLGDCYRNLKQYNYAAVPYGKAIGFEPDRADSYYGLGLTYVGLGNKVAARQQHRKLEPLDPGLAAKLKELIDGM